MTQDMVERVRKAMAPLARKPDDIAYWNEKAERALTAVRESVLREMMYENLSLEAKDAGSIAVLDVNAPGNETPPSEAVWTAILRRYALEHHINLEVSGES